MALVIEDGTGVENADSYVTITYVNDYHTARGATKWTGADSLKEQCIRRATDYIEKRFGHRFRGVKQSRAQALSWPRFNAKDNSGFLYNEEDIIPRKLKMAVAEYALRALLQGELAPDPGLPVAGQNNATGSTPPSASYLGKVMAKTETVGPISTSTQYQTSAYGNSPTKGGGLVSSDIIPEYPAADLLMAELLTSNLARQIRRG